MRLSKVSGRIVPLAWIAGIALVMWLVFGPGFANYDTFYALLWGNEIAAGQSPDLDIVLPPTPHPLATAVGIVLAPLGAGAEQAALAIAFLSLGAMGYLVYRLGSEWFGRAVGLVAAAIVLTRVPLVDFGARAYVDVPYIALVLGALLVETKRPRAAWPVLVLLALAGLLRPEAWLFSGAYVLYLAYGRRERRQAGLAAPLRALVRPRDLLGPAAIAASAPILWALSDFAFAGDALHSFTGTHDTVDRLGRERWIGGLITEGPQRLGEVVREPVLLGAAAGVVLAITQLRRRATLALAAGVLAAAAFAVLAIAGLAVITRYLLLVGTILSIFCALAALGWTMLEPGRPERTLWGGVAAAVVVALAVFAPGQAERLDDLRAKLDQQERIQRDLERLADSGAVDPDCAPVSAPGTRPVPMLALWLDRRPSEILPGVRPENGELVPVDPQEGYWVEPASAPVEESFELDPNDPGRRLGPVPPDFEPVYENRSWTLYARCP